MTTKRFLGIILSIIIAETAGLIGSLATFKAIPDWYATLNKPFFNPPNWLFGPVWTILYALMGIAIYLVWEKRHTDKKQYGKAVSWYILQLILNSLWSIIFFGLKTPWIALVEVIILWYAILQTIVNFKKISGTASQLLYPYIGWVSFAALLNLAIGLLN